MKKVMSKIKTEVKAGHKIAIISLMLFSLGMFFNFIVLVFDADQAKISKKNVVTIATAEINFNIDLRPIVKQKIKYQDQEYSILQFQEGKTMYPDKEGLPQLPYTSQFVAIPDQASNIKVSYKVNDTVKTEDIVVYPVPRMQVDQKSTDVSKSLSGEEYCNCLKPVFYMNQAIYDRDLLISENTVQIVKDFYLRSQRLLELKINPLKYNPKQRELHQAKDIAVSISYTLNKNITTKKNRIGSQREFMQSLVVNPEDIKPDVQQANKSGSVLFLGTNNLSNTSNSINYLIITHGDFYTSSELSDFANYRANNDNYKVGVVSVEDIYLDFPNAQHDQSIKDFVQYAYDNWQVPPALILLLGDIEWVPTHLVYTSSDDLVDMELDKWFAYVSGEDEVQDIAVGRLSVHSVADIVNIYDKIQHYEQDPIVFGDYHYQANMVDTIDFNYTISNLWQKLAYIGLNVNTFEDVVDTDVIDNFAANILAYYGHGNIGVWQTSPSIFDFQDFLSLQNTYENPFIFSGGCRTGNITYGDGFGGALVRLPQKGAIGLYGPTTLAYSFLPSDFFIEAVMDNLEYRVGFNTLYGEVNYSNSTWQKYLLQSDPGLHLFGHGSSPNLPDIAIAKNYVDFDQTQKVVEAEVKNLGGAEASNVLVELYFDINGIYVFQSSALTTIPANSSVIVNLPIIDLASIKLGENGVRVVVNHPGGQHYVVESFPFNNQTETFITAEGVNSIINFVDHNNQPVYNATVKAFDLDGNYLGETGFDTQGQAIFETIPGQEVRFEVWKSFDTQAGPGYPMINCLADETGYVATPSNITVHLSEPVSHFVYIDTDGVEKLVRYTSARDEDNNVVCSNVTSGLNMNLYIKPGTTLRFGNFSGSEFWTPFTVAPTTAYHCDAGDCCVEGTKLGRCTTNQPEYCSDETELVDNCQLCGCPDDLYCSESNTCITNYRIDDPF